MAALNIEDREMPMETSQDEAEEPLLGRMMPNEGAIQNKRDEPMDDGSWNSTAQGMKVRIARAAKFAAAYDNGSKDLRDPDAD